MANPAEMPRWRPSEFRLVPPAIPEAVPEAVPGNMEEAAVSVFSLLGGAAIGAVGFSVAAPSCLSGDSTIRGLASPETGLAVGLLSAVIWAFIMGDLWAGAAGVAGAGSAYAICKYTG
jgi:hypothetical protein